MHRRPPWDQSPPASGCAGDRSDLVAGSVITGFLHIPYWHRNPAFPYPYTFRAASASPQQTSSPAWRSDVSLFAASSFPATAAAAQSGRRGRGVVRPRTVLGDRGAERARANYRAGRSGTRRVAHASGSASRSPPRWCHLTRLFAWLVPATRAQHARSPQSASVCGLPAAFGDVVRAIDSRSHGRQGRRRSRCRARRTGSRRTTGADQGRCQRVCRAGHRGHGRCDRKALRRIPGSERTRKP
jgi:hypothetical protein